MRFKVKDSSDLPSHVNSRFYHSLTGDITSSLNNHTLRTLVGILILAVSVIRAGSAAEIATEPQPSPGISINIPTSIAIDSNLFQQSVLLKPGASELPIDLFGKCLYLDITPLQNEPSPSPVVGITLSLDKSATDAPYWEHVIQENDVGNLTLTDAFPNLHPELCAVPWIPGSKIAGSFPPKVTPAIPPNTTKESHYFCGEAQAISDTATPLPYSRTLETEQIFRLATQPGATVVPDNPYPAFAALQQYTCKCSDGSAWTELAQGYYLPYGIEGSRHYQIDKNHVHEALRSQNDFTSFQTGGWGGSKDTEGRVAWGQPLYVMYTGVVPNGCNGVSAEFSSTTPILEKGDIATLTYNIDQPLSCTIFDSQDSDDALSQTAYGTKGIFRVSPEHNTEYFLKCYDEDKLRVTKSLKLSVLDPPLVDLSLVNNLLATPPSVSISYRIENSESCTGSGDWQESPDLHAGSAEGTVLITPDKLKGDKLTFSLSCSNALKTSEKHVDLDLPQKMPLANPSIQALINSDLESATLPQSPIQNSTQPQATLNVPPSPQPSQLTEISTSSRATTANDIPIASALKSLVSKPEITAFSASPAEINQGQSTHLVWSVSKASACALSTEPEATGLTNLDARGGALEVTPHSDKTTYVLRCRNEDGFMSISKAIVSQSATKSN